MFRAYQYLVRDSETPQFLFQILGGWAGRYRMLPDGRRQITGLYLPGDICDPAWIEMKRSTEAVSAITPLRMIRMSSRDAADELDHNPQFMATLWRAVVRQQMLNSEWLLNIGRKHAIERISHLFCELSHRLQLTDHATDTDCEMPLTQQDLADLVGLTPVHVNRTLRELRAMRLIELQGRRLRILDLAGLAKLGWFDADYLHRGGSKEPDPMYGLA